MHWNEKNLPKTIQKNPLKKFLKKKTPKEKKKIWERMSNVEEVLQFSIDFCG